MLMREDQPLYEKGIFLYFYFVITLTLLVQTEAFLFLKKNNVNDNNYYTKNVAIFVFLLCRFRVDFAHKLKTV